MSIESRMNDTAIFMEPREIHGGWNEDRTEYAKIGTAPCRLVNLSGRKYHIGKPRDEATHRLFCISGLTISTSWIVEIGRKRYSIIPPVSNAGGGIDHHIEISLKEIQ